MIRETAGLPSSSMLPWSLRRSLGWMCRRALDDHAVPSHPFIGLITRRKGVADLVAVAIVDIESDRAAIVVQREGLVEHPKLIRRGNDAMLRVDEQTPRA